jgi:hypothetical protein
MGIAAPLSGATDNTSMIQSIVNQKVSDLNSTIDQNSIAMDFKAFHIITENTLPD